MDHLKNILAGLASVLVIAPDSDYIHPQRGGFARDARRMRKDVQRLGSDMRRVTENCESLPSRNKYGKQVNDRKG